MLSFLAGVLANLICATFALAGAVVLPTVAGQTAAQVQTAISAAMPPICASAPPSDTLNGSLGSGALCLSRQDATRPTVVQRAIVTTDGTGAWSVTWARPFAVQPALSLKPVMTPPSRGDCGITSSTASGAAGTCWTYQSVVVTALGATLSPLATAAAGVQVMIVGGAPTQ